MDTNTIVTPAATPGPTVEQVPTAPIARVRVWPVAALALPAFVAIWSGWVGLGGMTGFGKVHPLPGTPLAGWTLDTSITLPIGMEVYAAYALRVWLAGHLPARATRFAKWSAIGSLVLGAAGQVAYHLMAAAGIEQAPWQITTVVACLPVAVLGMGAALAHLIRDTSPAPPVRAAGTSPTRGFVNYVAGTDLPPNAAALREADDHEPEDATDVEEYPTATPPPRPAPRFRPTGQAVVQAADDAQAPAPARRRGGRPAGQTGTGVKVTRLAARHPNWTVKQIAEKAGVSPRTARRYLNPPAPAPAGDNAPDSPADTGVDGVVDGAAA